MTDGRTRRAQGQGGFTLLEILAALAVGATVLLATIGLVRSLTFTFDRGTRRVDQAEQLVLAVERLSQDIASTRYGQREAGGRRRRSLVRPAGQIVVPGAGESRNQSR